MKKYIALIALLSIVVLWLFGNHSTYSMNTVDNEYQISNHIHAKESVCNRYMLKHIPLTFGDRIGIMDYGNDMLLCIAYHDNDELRNDILFSLSNNPTSKSETMPVRWKYEINGSIDEYYALEADFASNKLYICQNNKLFCINLDNGKLLWKTEIEYPFHGGSNIVISDNRLYIPSKLHLSCYNSENGLQLWDRMYANYKGDPNIYTRMLINNESLFLRKGSSVIRMNAITGETIWDYHHDLCVVLPINLAISNKHVIFSLNGISIVFLDIDNGDVVRINNCVCFVDNYIVSNNDLYFIEKNTHLTKINDKLEVVWERDLTSAKSDSIRFILSNENNIIISGYWRVHIVDAYTSNIIQYFDIDSCFGMVHSEDMSNFYFGTREGLYLMSLATNSLIYKLNSNTYNPNNDDPREMDVEPIVRNGRTLLPARYVVEPLGGQVFWDGDERKVTCKLVAPDNPETDGYKENVVELWIDKPIAKINGAEVQIDPDNPSVVPTIINDRTMVPMRFLAESLGCEVEWVAETKEIILTYGK